MKNPLKACWCDIPIELHSDWMMLWHALVFEWRFPQLVVWLDKKLTGGKS